MKQEQKNLFQLENDQVLKTILNERFFKPWHDKATNSKFEPAFSIGSEGYLELFVTSSCNYKCQYCYLHNNHNLYPAEANKPEKILNNLRILFDYILEKDYSIPQIELFSGEIWHLAFGHSLLDIIYEYLIKGLKCNRILIPSNCTFANDKVAVQLIQQYIDKYMKIGVALQFSISIDGKIIDCANRPSNDLNEQKDDLFYDNIFLFASRNGFTFHPMVNAYSIEKWIENYEWWKETCTKYGYEVGHDVMMLEVRNNDWTAEKIQEYCKFIEHIFLDHLQYLRRKHQRGKFVDYLLGRNLDPSEVIGGYSPYYLVPSKTFASCTITNHLTVRLGDLAICPCHRTAYPEQLYGQFIVENNKIKDITSVNIYNAARILFGNEYVCHVKCDSCLYSKYCIRNCFGSQFETNQDMFLPMETVCALLQAKMQTVCRLYEENGIIEQLESITPLDLHYPNAQKLLCFIREVKDDLEKKEEARS